MLKDLFLWFLNSLSIVFNSMRSFVLDSSAGITFFHFLIFIIFIRILFYLLEFIRNIYITTNEDESTTKHERRYKR